MRAKVQYERKQFERWYSLIRKMSARLRRVAGVGVLGSLLLLAACGGEETATPAATSESTAAETIEVEASSTATHTAAPPTETVEPTVEPTATAEEVATETPAAQTPEPTAAAETPAAESTTPSAESDPLAEIDSRGATMMLVPGAAFLVGWERQELLEECESFREGCAPPLFTAAGPIHQVQLDAFYIDANEVTNEEFAAFLTEIGTHTGVCFGQDCIGLDRSAIQQQGENAFAVADTTMSTHPVTGVTWFGAAAFCQWRGARLPTSAEWEMAAAWDPESGEKTRYPWGNEFDPAAANFCDAGCDAHDFADEEHDDGFARTAPVGSFPAGQSHVGAFDMAGNVWEWVLDWFDEEYYDLLIEEGVFPVVDPVGPESSDRRVVRGGSWFDTGNFTSSVFRAGVDPTLSDDTLGFRCAADG